MNAPAQVDYLVGGPRISIAEDSNTPGPRTHIIEFTAALRRAGHRVNLTLASDLPFMGRFTRIKQSDYGNASRLKLHLADGVRVASALWCGLFVFSRSWKSPAPSIIYERSAAVQSLSSFHFHKRRALRVIEANGIFSRETAEDRKALGIQRTAAMIERHALRKADLIVAISRPLAREIESFAGVDPTNILVVSNGLDPALSAMPAHRRSDKVILGFVGSLAKWQHLPAVIAKFDALANELDQLAGRRVEFEIIGDGADRDDIDHAIKSLADPTRVTAFGNLPHDQAISRIATWHVGFAGHQKSSAAEMYHSPLKLYEYAGLGLDIVCTHSDDARALAASGTPVQLFADMHDLSQALLTAVEHAAHRSRSSVETQRSNVTRDHSWDARAMQFLTRTKSLGATT